MHRISQHVWASHTHTLRTFKSEHGRKENLPIKQPWFQQPGSYISVVCNGYIVQSTIPTWLEFSTWEPIYTHSTCFLSWVPFIIISNSTRFSLISPVRGLGLWWQRFGRYFDHWWHLIATEISIWKTFAFYTPFKNLRVLLRKKKAGSFITIRS